MARLNDSRIGAVLGEDLAVRATTRTFASPHAAHGVAMFIGVERDVEVGSARGRVVVVPADHEHAVASSGPTIGICFDPERLPHVAGYARRCGQPHVVEGRTGHMIVEAAHAHRAQLTRSDVLDGLAREAARAIADSPVRLDSRVARVVEALRDPAREVPPLSISDAHLQELFARDVGLPIRSFRLWRRLLDALPLFMTTDATTAAHAAGFSDLAHFSRTCRRFLGYSPTILRDGV